MPHPQPALGSKLRLYRLTHNTAYHVGGTVVCLDESDVNDTHHERIPVALEPEDEQRIKSLETEVTALKRVLATLRVLLAPVDTTPVAPVQPGPPA